MRHEEEREFHSDRRARVEGRKKRAGLGVVGEKKGDEGGQCGWREGGGKGDDYGKVGVRATK